MLRAFMLAAILVTSLIVVHGFSAQTTQRTRPGSSSAGASPGLNTPRPIDAHDSVFVEELTWMEVRDAMRQGKTTVIIATGGIEQSGPYLAVGKHNYILRATTEVIARRLGNALVAPIVSFVPEGDISPPSGFMRYPGTVGVQQETFKRLLSDIASCFRAHGFEHIILIGDHGSNQTGMKEVAEELSGKWKGGKTDIHYIPEYYDYPGLTAWLESQGIEQVDEGLHDDYGISVLMMTIDTELVRMKERTAKGKFTINGVPLYPLENSIAIGRRAVDYRAAVTVSAIRKVLGK
jgi:creatinine amidohydrolase/Fe(II)-dependent formamide hydrolase-like protein